MDVVQMEQILQPHFQWPDFLVFAVMLVISLAIGIYCGCKGSGQRTTAEFFMGGRTMGIFPVSMSLAARYSCTPNILQLYQK